MSFARAQLARHVSIAHSTFLVWHACPFPSCDYKANRKDGMKQHAKKAHGVTLTNGKGGRKSSTRPNQPGSHYPSPTKTNKLHICPTCSQTYPTAAALTKHRKNTHSKTVTWHSCPCSNTNGTPCVYRATRQTDMAHHLTTIHGTTPTEMYGCEHTNCKHRASTRTAIIEHMAEHRDTYIPSTPHTPIAPTTTETTSTVYANNASQWQYCMQCEFKAVTTDVPLHMPF